jgi:D-alanyl-D-alanine carboxypeptidase/D-alanyl-D-alanine-endopeptidase (penicillin-binding protein 4)
MRAWADSLRAHGISRIEGGIIGVDSAFSGPPLGAGWAWDDLGEDYAAEFGALQFNEGVVGVQVVPGRTVGQPAIVVLDPPTQYVRVENAVVTAARGAPPRLEITREPAGPRITVAGRIPADSAYLMGAVAVRDPPGYFLSVLRETLREEGIAVEGQALNASEWPAPRSPASDVPLFSYASPPLREILPAMLKPSQNWIAETLLHTLGHELRGTGSAEAGEAVVDSVFRHWQLPVDGLRQADGSGLSRYDLVTPELLVALLAHMRQSPNWELWYASLPVGGVDGTLANRMKSPPLHANVHAKTGTLTGVRSLSGYLTTTSGEPVVFSILINHHLHGAHEVDAVVDAALALVAAGL